MRCMPERTEGVGSCSHFLLAGFVGNMPELEYKEAKGQDVLVTAFEKIYALGAKGRDVSVTALRGFNNRGSTL